MFSAYASRPRVQVPFTTGRILLEALAAAAMIFIAVQLISAWPTLPDRVPTHFGLNGEPNQWSSRNGVLIVPIAALLLWVSMTALTFVPHIHNFPTAVTPENAPRLYAMSAGMLTLIKTEVLCMMAYALWSTVEVAMRRAQEMNSALFLAFIGVILLTAIGSTIRFFSIR
ncbi:MAG: DUF1648 domain-containing protein [Bryobacteraceae bacterium]